jgi:hypothetical protein
VGCAWFTSLLCVPQTVCGGWGRERVSAAVERVLLCLQGCWSQRRVRCAGVAGAGGRGQTSLRGQFREARVPLCVVVCVLQVCITEDMCGAG